MKTKGAFVVEQALADAGVNVSAAKVALSKLDDLFQGEAGDIPAGALGAWVTEFFDSSKQRAFFMELGRAWEDEHAASLQDDRKWERSPGAAEEKIRRNAEKAKAKVKG